MAANDRGHQDGSVRPHQRPDRRPATWLARVTATRLADYTTFARRSRSTAGRSMCWCRRWPMTRPGAGDPRPPGRRPAAARATIGLPYPLLGALVMANRVPGRRHPLGEPAPGTRRSRSASTSPTSRSCTSWRTCGSTRSSRPVDPRGLGRRPGRARRPGARPRRCRTIRPRSRAGYRQCLTARSLGASAASRQQRVRLRRLVGLVADVRAEIGDDASKRSWPGSPPRSAYDAASVDPPPAGRDAASAAHSRAFLDQIAAVAGVDLSAAFSASAFSAANVELLRRAKPPPGALGDLARRRRWLGSTRPGAWR